MSTADNSNADPCRLAALTACEDLARLARRLADRLGSGQALPPPAVALLLVDAGKLIDRLGRDLARLGPPGDSAGSGRGKS